MRALVNVESSAGNLVLELEFLQLPAPGDRIMLRAASAEQEVHKVLYVEHYPTTKDGQSVGGYGLMAIVVVEPMN